MEEEEQAIDEPLIRITLCVIIALAAIPERPGGQHVISFKDNETKAIFDGVSSKSARRRCPVHLWNIAKRKLDALNAASRLEDLRSPGNNLERLKDDRAGQHSIRINDKYRVCFVWKAAGAEQVEITDYH